MRDTSSGSIYRDSIVQFIRTEFADLSLIAKAQGNKSEILIKQPNSPKIFRVLCMTQDVKGTAEQKIDSKLADVRKTPGASLFLYRGVGFSQEATGKLTTASEAINFDVSSDKTQIFASILRAYFS